MEHDDAVTYIGMRHEWGGLRPFGLSPAARRHHAYVVGQTGTGKTTLLRNMIVQDVERGLGVGVIDPHGDLAEDLLDCIPGWRADHVVYFDPADRECSVGLSLFGRSSPDVRHVVASGVVAAFKGIWRDSWGPRLEYVLYATVAALQECENVSLLGVPRMLADAGYRAWVLRQVTDPVVRAFWLSEFAGYDRRFVAEVIAPVQNKVGQFLMAAPVRHVLGQVGSKVDFRFMMDRQRIFIANLSKGRLGEDKANLLGSLLVTQFRLAAMSRADRPAADRRDFNLYVDEFQNFATDGFAGILSESRKYALALVLANQFTAQIRPDVRDAVFGNVGTVVEFRTGDADAVQLAREFGRHLTPSLFTDLANHEVCVKLLNGGRYGEPFLGRTLAPLPIARNRGDAVRRNSRQKYGKRRAAVEERIERWLRS